MLKPRLSGTQPGEVWMQGEGRAEGRMCVKKDPEMGEQDNGKAEENAQRSLDKGVMGGDGR